MKKHTTSIAPRTATVGQRRAASAAVVGVSVLVGTFAAGHVDNTSAGASPPLSTIVTPIATLAPTTTAPATTIARPTTSTVPRTKPTLPVSVPESGTFVKVSPCRIVDTRNGNFRIGDLDRLGPDSTNVIQVANESAEHCSIPDDAKAVSLNVTALGATAPTFLTLFPAGEPVPNASNLNPVPGAPPTPNAVVVPMNAIGEVAVYNAFGSVDVIVDLNGYFGSGDLMGLSDRIGRLDRSVPVVDFDYTVSMPLDEVGTPVASVRPEPNQSGTLVVSASATAFTTTPNMLVECWVSSGLAFDDQMSFTWESSGNTGGDATSGESSTLAATMPIDVERPGLHTINMLCRRGVGGAVTMRNANLVVTFIPG